MNDVTDLLVMRNITKRFPGVVALSDVTFQLEHGEIHGIVGENGAGKSTLIKVLTGAESLESGEIFLSGKKIEPEISAPRATARNQYRVPGSESVPTPFGCGKHIHRATTDEEWAHRLERNQQAIRSGTRALEY